MMLKTLKILDEEVKRALYSGVLFEQIDSKLSFARDLMDLRIKENEAYEESLNSYITELKNNLSNFLAV